MQRPTGVTVLAVLAAIGGIFGILGGLALVGLGGMFAAAGGGGLAAIVGLVVLALSVVDLALAYGFWMLKPWAWKWGIVAQAISVIVSIVEVPAINAQISSLVIPIAVSVIIVYYLGTADVRKAFGAPEKGWPFMGSMGR